MDILTHAYLLSTRIMADTLDSLCTCLELFCPVVVVSDYASGFFWEHCRVAVIFQHRLIFFFCPYIV